ncbi:5'-3' exoribonuclease 2 [Pleurotus pulmonarius]|nr:5'-3' exoribonuclease 2 [Pleurotus pulmonarius]KAF4600744.1 5'-3' exoribonuclease 2 [Pleurotus pulmonarius]
MGVPALFRWLSKKYPKIIFPVEEEDDTVIPVEDGEPVSIPVNICTPNPNGMEFDHLYLDMNGIVHPCTHPEGKPPPATEEEMMGEIFKYTERVVNMIRPRKLLFMAIDGVAPRAKMNQQRSRRFRAAQEAADKEKARQESLLLWEAMGQKVEDLGETVPPWDSNAITPGTPFMDLLATSLRYWVALKINTDPGWHGMQVIISDASVPGEGEHKIMDFIRRQRTNPGYDPNTKHVIYGLDADLIMLALATHEPYFRVLREDVFANDVAPNACRICGQEGHRAAQCTGTPMEKKKTPTEKKPFIFLDVAILREYLEVELNVSNQPFPFDLERAIDDWVLLIFFVGNDFLPHLPSLEIREGAIDTLLKIWKQELPRMGGYLTNHGHMELKRAEIILEGLAQREDDIFRRRRETEERQDQNAKRRKIEEANNKKTFSMGPSASLGLTSAPTAPSSSAHPSLPQRPDFAANADSIGLGAKPTVESVQYVASATTALAGSNRDVVANRAAIRMANMSAAEVLKAELSSLVPVKPSASSLPKQPVSTPDPTPSLPTSAPPTTATVASEPEFEEIPGLTQTITVEPHVNGDDMNVDAPVAHNAEVVNVDPDAFIASAVALGSNGTDTQPSSTSHDELAGTKRKFGEGPGETEEDPEVIEAVDDEDGPAEKPLALTVRPDGTVEQEDTVRLWEPGYKARYYQQKFGFEPSDQEAKKKITKCYIEGLCWVLHYYYQGTPAWQWFYPYHFAPFAGDFEEVDKMDITFEAGQPSKPFEQLMGVFPAASRKHIPEAFQHLMIDEESPILDFYPTEFQIDMNGKKMAWQGVALLPFIDEKRLLETMAKHYPKLTESEVLRNRWGNNVLFASNHHPIYPFYESLYGKRKTEEPVPIDPALSKGMSGTVLPNAECIPGATYYCPLTSQGLPDIKNDQSLSVYYFFPKQLTPHRSVLLPGVRPQARKLSAQDLENTRNGYRRGRGRGGGFERGGEGRAAWRERDAPPRDDARPYAPRGHPAPGGWGGRGTSPYPPRNALSHTSQYGGYGGDDGGQRSQPGYGGYGQPSRGGPPNHGNIYDNRGGYRGNNNGDNYGNYGRGRGGSSGGNYGSGGYGSVQGGGYNNSQGGRGGYGGYGNGNSGNSGYGGYGGQPNATNGTGGYGGYNNGGRGGAYNRARGRGW